MIAKEKTVYLFPVAAVTTTIKTTEIYFLIVLESKSLKSVSLGLNEGVTGPFFIWRL